MSESSAHTIPDTNLRTIAEKVALGWDFESLEQRMEVRLEKVRRAIKGEGADAKAPKFVEKENIRQ